MNQLINYEINNLCKRSTINGGFKGRINGGYRTDATAWVAIAFSVLGTHMDIVQKARSRLVMNQHEDGRVFLSKEFPEVCWPTPLAVMAWEGSIEHKNPQLKAVEFLLRYEGVHFIKEEDNPLGHDTSIRGWPWIANTHSWVESTSFVLMALQLTGNGENLRAKEARKMLMDRQLSQGGWNYGNTTVFGRELRPMPESTGIALCALANKVERKSVEKSIVYLKKTVSYLSTPISLCWSLFGLSAWDEYPDQADDLLKECLYKQNTFGPYDTFQLALLLVSIKSQNKFLEKMHLI